MLSEDVRTVVDLFRYHAPLERLEALPVVLASAVAGMVLCLGGARSVRTLVTALGGILGAILGAWLSVRTPFPAWLTVTVGVFGFGYLGNVGYRVWVGVGSGMMLTSLILTVYVGHTVLPRHQEFTRSLGGGGGYGNLKWRIPTMREAKLARTEPNDYFKEFRAYFARREPNASLHLVLMIVPSAVAGLIFGMLSPLAACILWTSLLGSAFLITAGISTIVAWHPEMGNSFVINAEWVGWLLLLVTILSIYFQAGGGKKKKSKAASPSGGSGGDGGSK